MLEKAVALKYEKDVDNAPYILAKGMGKIGEYIINIAKDNDIPILKNEELVNTLWKLKENEEIPVELYTIIAEIFAFVYSLKDGDKEIERIQ